jgi:hypothetical protein
MMATGSRDSTILTWDVSNVTERAPVADDPEHRHEEATETGTAITWYGHEVDPPVVRDMCELEEAHIGDAIGRTLGHRPAALRVRVHAAGEVAFLRVYGLRTDEDQQRALVALSAEVNGAVLQEMRVEFYDREIARRRPDGGLRRGDEVLLRTETVKLGGN